MRTERVLCADIGGTNIRTSLVDTEGTILAKAKKPTGRDPLPVLVEALGEVLTDEEEGVVGIGIAVAGVIDTDRGLVLISPNIPSLGDCDLAGALTRHFTLPVLVVNDANAAAYGERIYGAGRQFDDFIMITLGTGIGGGIVHAGKLLPIAAEVGHMTIRAEGVPCACGNRGCFERYSSATALVNAAETRMRAGETTVLAGQTLSAESIYHAALSGDSLAIDVLRNAGRDLGAGIANLINLFAPEAVLLGGGLAAASEFYIETALQELSARALGVLSQSVVVRTCELGDDAGLKGAAALVFDAHAGKH